MSVANDAPSKYHVNSVVVDEDSVTIQYMHLPHDVRVRGRVVQQHQVTLHRSHPDYDEDAERIVALLRKVLLNALDDFDASSPYVPEVDEEEDDDRGLGDG